MSQALVVIYVVLSVFFIFYAIGCAIARGVRALEIKDDSKKARQKIDQIVDVAAGNLGLNLSVKIES